ncbi:ABC transporter permease [Candidatus Latescibacterota bacterium]
MPSATTLRIAWRSLGRNRKRSLLTLGAIAVGQFAFLATCALIHGYSEVFLESATGPMLGHAQVHAPEWRDDRAIDLTLQELDGMLDALRSDSQVVGALPRIFAPAMAALTEEGFMAVVVGVDPQAEDTPKGMLGGAGLSQRLGDGQVLVGRVLAHRQELDPGMELAIIGQDADGSIASGLYTVSGILPSALSVVSNLGVVMSLADAQELLRMTNEAHEIVLHVVDAKQLEQTVERLGRLPGLEDVELLPWQELAPHIVTMVGFMDAYTYIILVIVFVAAAAGIANTMLMSTFERTHELGMLLSLGCGPGRLWRMVAAEAVILGLIGVAVGTGLGLWLVEATAETGMDYAALGGSDEGYEVAFQGMQLSSRVYPKLFLRDVASGVTAVLVTTILAIVWPALHIARLEPMEALRS